MWRSVCLLSLRGRPWKTLNNGYLGGTSRSRISKPYKQAWSVLVFRDGPLFSPSLVSTGSSPAGSQLLGPSAFFSSSFLIWALTHSEPLPGWSRWDQGAGYGEWLWKQKKRLGPHWHRYVSGDPLDSESEMNVVQLFWAKYEHKGLSVSSREAPGERMIEDTTSDSFDLFISQSPWLHQIFSMTLNNCCVVLLLVAHNFSKLRGGKKTGTKRLCFSSMSV